MSMNTYVAAFKNTILDTYESFDVAAGQLHGYVNPALARIFSSEREALDFINTYNGTMLELKPIQLETAVRAYNAFVRRFETTPYRSVGIKSVSLSRPYAGESALDVLKWHLAYRKGDESTVAYDDFKTWPRLYSQFKHLWEVGAFDPKHKYVKADYLYSVTLKVDFDSVIDTFKDELALIIDEVTYLDENGSKVFPIFDHFLSEGGNSASFVAKKDGTYAIVGRYGSSELISGDLAKVFDWWKRNRPYRTSGDE